MIGMNKPTPNLSPDLIIEIVMKRRWIIIIPFLVSMVVGLYLAITLPKVYRAQTLILVQPQRVPTEFIRSVVSSDIDERISTISQQIMSRTNLEKVIAQFKLFDDADSRKMFLEDQIDNLRKRITVEISSDRKKGTDAFSISFKGQNPDRVMRVTNTLASYFIDENLKVREAQAIGTSDFLQDELETMRQRLTDLEESLKTYRIQHMGALPEQLQTNLQVLSRLQEELNANQLRFRDARQQQIFIEKQIAEEKSQASLIPNGITQNPGQAAPPESGAVRMERLSQQLKELQARYTDRHPDIIRLKKQMQELETQLVKTDISKSAETTETTSPAPTQQSKSSTTRSLERQLAVTLSEISKLEFEIPKIEEKIRAYQERVEQTPKIEQELLSLQRDYINIKASYDSLLTRKNEAEMAVNMEKKQKGEQFRIVDPARVPTKPIEPDMKKLFLLTVAAGLAVGGGLVFLLEFLNHSFKSSDQIETELGCKVLATIPTIETPKAMWRKRINLAFTIVSVVVALSLLTGLASFTLIGERQTKEFVRMIIPS